MAADDRGLRWLRRAAALGLTGLLAATAPARAEQPAAPPLAPSGKWVVAFEDDLCVASRDYGVGRDKVGLGFRPFPTQQEMEVVLVERMRGGGYERNGKGRITLDPGGDVTEVGFKSFAIDAGRSITHIYAERPLLTRLANASTITIDVDHRVRTLGLNSTGPLIATLHRCEVQLLQHWGVDPDRFFGASPPVPVEGNPARWFGPYAYPPEAIRNHEQGRVVVLLAIDAAGRVGDCRVVTSSKSRPLDDTTCRVARRIRYTPSHDAGGTPVATWSVLPVVWLLPR